MKQKDSVPSQDVVTIISTGVLLEGKITSKGNIRIDGQVKGDIHANGNVTIGSQGEVNGEIVAQIITLGGTVNGSLKANEKIIMESTASLKGDLVSKILIIEEGAVFDGNSSMSKKEDIKKIIEAPDKKE